MNSGEQNNTESNNVNPLLKEAFQELWLTINKLTDKLASTQKELQSLRIQQASNQFEPPEIESDVSEFRSEFEKLTKLNAEYESRIIYLEELIKEKTQVIVSLEDRLAQPESLSLFEEVPPDNSVEDNSVLLEENIDLKEKLETLDKKYKDNESKYSELIEIKHKELEKLSTDLNNLTEENISIKNKLNQIDIDRDRLEDNKQQELIRFEFDDNEIKKLESQIEKLKLIQKELSEQNVVLKDELLSQKADYDLSISNYEKKYEQQEIENEQLKLKINDLTSLSELNDKLLAEAEENLAYIESLEQKIREFSQKTKLNELKIDEAIKLNQELEISLRQNKEESDALKNRINTLSQFESEFHANQAQIERLKKELSKINAENLSSNSQKLDLESRIYEILKEKHTFKQDLLEKIDNIVKRFENLTNLN